MRAYRFIVPLALVCLASAAGAQSATLYRVGFLSPGGFAPGTNQGDVTDEIVRDLARRGFTNGANLELVKRGAEAHFERLPGLVADLVAAKIDVIVTFSYPVAEAAKAGTSTVPLVSPARAIR
jgi:putative tryptophan/tyrosine transport system substrate-binding protein